MVKINPKHFQTPPSKWDKYAKQLIDDAHSVGNERLWWPSHNDVPRFEGSGEYLSLESIPPISRAALQNHGIDSIEYSHDAMRNITIYTYYHARRSNDMYPGTYRTVIFIHDSIIERFITTVNGFPELIITTDNSEAYRHFTNRGYIKVEHH